ncbi:tyrosine-type recombinase/integrase [Cellulosilyticum sp. I15G10I2]|uniref:tyrosine-type recombinase/integrase n=1 Tax=Cellulosilyticum sp. I15G10I2 TaxID=1892843 RepID=UPI00085BE02A|nr:tyrosine-type recombinase/integrase [Cellulosilyticum sp. I15G10I2]
MNTVEPIRDFGILLDIGDVIRERRERDYVLYMSALYLGRRISDILPLKVRDIKNLDYLYLREDKTNKEAVIEIHEDLKVIYKQYCEGKKDREYLFRRSKGKNEPITRQWFWRILHEAAKEVGYKEKIGCHSLRKSMGYWMFKNGVDPYTIMLFLNHSDIATTKRYIGVTRDDISKATRKVSFTKRR